jgi:hypothetical protein
MDCTNIITTLLYTQASSNQVHKLNADLKLGYIPDFCLRLLWLWETGPVRKVLGSCACFKFKISVSSFPIFMTFVSDRSFYEKRAAHARFGLLCASARSDQVQNLHAALKLVYLHFLFSWHLSQIAPSMRNGPRAHALGLRAHVHAPIIVKICVQP